MPESKPPPKSCPDGDGISIPCREYINEVLRLNLEPFRVELMAAKDAVTKAEQTLGIRLEGMNEFRQQMKDQVETFMPRTEIDARFATVQSVGLLWGLVMAMLVVGLGAVVTTGVTIVQTWGK